jgi:hypothetical protein
MQIFHVGFPVLIKLNLLRRDERRDGNNHLHRQVSLLYQIEPTATGNLTNSPREIEKSIVIKICKGTSTSKAFRTKMAETARGMAILWMTGNCTSAF